MPNPNRPVRWRIGSHIPINVYEGDRPVCQCHNALDAARIVLAMNRRITAVIPPKPAPPAPQPDSGVSTPHPAPQNGTDSPAAPGITLVEGGKRPHQPFEYTPEGAESEADADPLPVGSEGPDAPTDAPVKLPAPWAAPSEGRNHRNHGIDCCCTGCVQDRAAWKPRDRGDR